MSTTTVTRRHTTAALAVTGLAVLIAAAPAVLMNIIYDARLRTLDVQLAAARLKSTQTQTLQAHVQGLRETAPGNKEFLQPGPAALAAADLQRRVQQKIEEHGGSLSSMLPLDAAPEQPFRRIIVKVRMQAGLPALQRILHALEQGVPSLFIDTLHITPAFITAHNRETDRLEASFDVSGYQYIEDSDSSHVSPEI